MINLKNLLMARTFLKSRNSPARSKRAALPVGVRTGSAEKLHYYGSLVELTLLLDGSSPFANANHKMVVAGFIHRKDRALFARRAPSKSIAPGQLHLPGGHVEAGEFLPEALRREIGEEFGVQVHVGDPIFLFEYEADGSPTLGVAFVASLTERGAVLCFDKSDNSEVLWVAREELDPLFPDRSNHNYLAAIEGFAFLQNLTSSDRGDLPSPYVSPP